MISVCPECEGEVKLDNARRGEIVSCPTCGVELEVTATDPLTLEPAPMEKEDWGE